MSEGRYESSGAAWIMVNARHVRRYSTYLSSSPNRVSTCPCKPTPELCALLMLLLLDCDADDLPALLADDTDDDDDDDDDDALMEDNRDDTAAAAAADDELELDAGGARVLDDAAAAGVDDDNNELVNSCATWVSSERGAAADASTVAGWLS